MIYGRNGTNDTEASRSLFRRLRAGAWGAAALMLVLGLIACAHTEQPGEVSVVQEVASGDLFEGRIGADAVLNEEGLYEFIYVEPAQAPEINRIFVPGSFNGWNNSSHEMERGNDGVWRVSARLRAGGRHEYKFYFHAETEGFENGGWVSDMANNAVFGHLDHNDQIDPTATGFSDDGHGGRNAFVDIVVAADEVTGTGFRHDPADPTHVSIADGVLSVRMVVHGGSVETAVVRTDGADYVMSPQLTMRRDQVYRAALPADTGGYEIVVTDRDGETLSHGPFNVPDNLFTALDWVGNAIGYQIFPDRFFDGDPSLNSRALETSARNYKHPDHWNWPGEPEIIEGWGGTVDDRHCCHVFFGGDFAGIIRQLDHLEDLGVSMIYLNPIFSSGSVHGYDAHDFFALRPNFGDEDVLSELLDEAHDRGMRVIWDFVPNHVGTGHWAFQQAIAPGGQETEYWDWFRFRVEPGEEIQAGNSAHYDSWWDLGNLPELETRNPAVFNHLIDAARHWTRFGFDGVRIDVPNDVINYEEFFPALREAVREENPEAYIVGEIWQRAPQWLQGDMFDSLMNYAAGQGIIEQFASGDMSSDRAIEEMQLLYASYPEASVAMSFNIISSHDTARLLTKMGAGGLGGSATLTHHRRARLAAAMLYALPGMPVTFQGDEIGMLGAGDGPREENRYPVQWDDVNEDTMEHYRLLGRLKRDLPALNTALISGFRSHDGVVQFRRGHDGEQIVLALFNGTSTRQNSIPLPEGSWHDTVSGRTYSGIIDLTAYNWVYLVRE